MKGKRGRKREKEREKRIKRERGKEEIDRREKE